MFKHLLIIVSPMLRITIVYPILYYAILCYGMLWYAMLCYGMLRYTMLWYAMLCYGMLCYTIPTNNDIMQSSKSQQIEVCIDKPTTV